MEGVYADEQPAIRGKRLCVPWQRPAVCVAYAAVYLCWRVTVSFGNGLRKIQNLGGVMIVWKLYGQTETNTGLIDFRK